MEDGLRAYREILTDRARDQHYRNLTIWALVTPHQKQSDRKPQPPLPAILRD